MTTQQPKSTTELLVVALAATVALFALTFEWRVIPGVYGEANLLFAPLLLASVYLALRWFGFDTAAPIFGIQPRTAWAAALLVIGLWASAAPLRAKSWIPIIGFIVLWIHGRVTRAAENVELPEN